MPHSLPKLCVLSPAHWAGSLGGAETQLRLLIERLITLGTHDIHYVARYVDPGHIPSGYRIHRVRTRKAIAGTYLLDLPDLRHILDSISPDVIYQRVGCTYTGAAAMYAVRNRRKLVWHVASDRDLLPAAWRMSLRTPFLQLDRRIIDYGAKHAQRIVVQNDRQRALLMQRFSRDDAIHIPNFHPAPEGAITKPARPVQVVWVSNVKPLKQLEYFVRLARDFAQRTDVEFTVIGAQQMTDAEWQPLLADMKATPNLRYLGVQPPQAVEEFLMGAHVFVNTSTVEGFPNTFIQSWLREVPVVALNVNPDGMLTDERYGFCAGGDYGQMRASIDRLVTDASLRTTMGKAAREMALAKFSYANRDRLIEMLTP